MLGAACEDGADETHGKGGFKLRVSGGELTLNGMGLCYNLWVGIDMIERDVGIEL